MTPDDRELLLSLRRQQQELQQTLERLNTQLTELEGRAEMPALPTEPPPLPEHPPDLPPIPHFLIPPAPTEPFQETPPPVPAWAETVSHDLPPVPEHAAPSTPWAESLPPVPKPSFEFQVGRWLTRVGAVLLVLSIVSFAIWADVNYHLHQLLGPWGKLGLMGLVSVVVSALGLRLEGKSPSMLVYGRTLTAAGLGGLYFTLYAAHEIDSLAVIHSPVTAGFLLLLWSVYVLSLAEQKKSEILSLFAITLAYFSSAINPVGGFTMVADLFLAATAVIFLFRNGWAALSYFSLLGTYGVLLRRLVVDEDGQLVLDTSRTLSFAPHAVYLLGAWIIFTAAVLFSSVPSFRGGKRLGFLSLNNGALAGLLALTAYISGYGYGPTSWTVLATGFLLLATSCLTPLGRAGEEAKEVAGTYLAQGLALVTLGIMLVYTGVSRGVLLAVETLFLGWAGSFSRSLILIAGAYVAAFFAALFLIYEIAINAHHPWVLGVGGAAVMFVNAWGARRDVRGTPQARDTIVLGASYYCALALGLIFTVLATSAEISDDLLPVALAVVGLALTFSIYFFPLYELPPIAQMFLLAAQAIVLFPDEGNMSVSRGSTAAVAAVTLLATTWWSRQKVTRSGAWIVVLNFVYALALVGLAYHAVRPAVGLENWMICASLLSVAFLAWGAFTRVWPLAVMGQIFFAFSLYHFFLPPGGWDVTPFPWSWQAMAVPTVVAFSIGRAIQKWLGAFPEITGAWRLNLSMLASFYQVLALALLIRWISALVPPVDQIPTFLFLGALLMARSVPRESLLGIRCSFVLSFLGVATYLGHFDEQRAMATLLNGLAILVFLAEPGLLRRQGEKTLVTAVESWILILVSAATGWIFVSGWVSARIHPHYITMGWGLYALFLFFFGLLVSERRQRWCGLVILVAAILRVGLYDIWGFSSGYRVLTLVVLTLVTLGLGFIYARFAERLKMWL